MKYRLMGLAALLPLSAPAQDSGVSPDGTDPLETVVVTATRTARDVADIPATVSVLSDEDIEHRLARDIRDLIRYEPGVSVGGTGDRFGLGGFTIRGIGGNRVLTLVDGVRVADAYGFGPFLSANRNYVDIDSLKAFEIVRGPGSALYGSDAIGGVVAYRTKDARDYLAGEPVYAGVKLGLSGVDDSSVGTLTLAGGGERLSASLIYSRRDASETENQGDVGGTGPTRTLPDPLDRESDNVVAELTFAPSPSHSLTFGAEVFDSATDTDVLSNYGVASGSAQTLSQRAHDEIERERLTLEYDYAPTGEAAIDRFQAQIYSQSSDQTQRTREERLSLTSGTVTNRARDSFFDQDVDGLSLQVDKEIGGDGARHYLIVGTEYWQTDSRSLRDGGSTDPDTGAPIPEFLPLPTRDFPPTAIDQYGIFVQDEIALLDERLVLTPSVRLDAFDADAQADAIYFSGNPGQPAPEDFDDSEVSPKVGLLYALTDRLRLYTQYAEGFKAPPYDDVNVGFTNPIGGYKTISNPDLESERSVARELGLRIATEAGNLSLVAFQNRYDNFIESFLPAPQFAASFGVDPADGLFTFQSQNLDRVDIEGVELSGRLGLGDGPFALNLSFAYARGEDAVTGDPLDSIDPLKAVVGLNYAAPSGRWGGDAVLTAVAGKDASDIASTRYATPGYGLVDLLGFYRFADNVRVNFGLFNIGDRDYVTWTDTGAIAYDDTTGGYPELGRFTRPGFNAGLTLRVEF